MTAADRKKMGEWALEKKRFEEKLLERYQGKVRRRRFE